MTNFTELFTQAVNTTIAQQVAAAMLAFTQRNDELIARIAELEGDKLQADVIDRIAALEETINEQDRKLEQMVEREVKSQVEDFIHNELDVDSAVEKAIDGIDLSDAVCAALAEDPECGRVIESMINEHNFTDCTSNFDDAVLAALTARLQ